MDENQLNQGTEPIVDPNGGQGVPGTVAAPTPSDTQNLDVLLQDPKLQAEFDKKLEKAISKAVKSKEQEYSKREAALQASISTEKEKNERKYLRRNLTKEERSRRIS